MGRPRVHRLAHFTRQEDQIRWSFAAVLNSGWGIKMIFFIIYTRYGNLCSNFKLAIRIEELASPILWKEEAKDSDDMDE